MRPKMDFKTSPLFKQQAYIGGDWVGAPGFGVTDKATGEVIARVPDMGREEAAAAIDAASCALPAWSTLLAKERSAYLRRWYDLIVAHQEELAHILSAEQGKPLSEARGEILYGASFVEFFAEEAKRIYGETIPTFKTGSRIVVLKQPIGVVTAITPWNFPTAMITRKVSPALGAGCTVVAKPAEDTPLSALALAELAHRAGFPKGVFNIVTGADPGPIGAEFTSNKKVKMVTFTGSTDVGKVLMRQCAASVKKVGLELGGNAPFIVFDDADLDAAIIGLMASKFRNAGQTCVCANRIFIQSKIYDAFAQRLVEAVNKLKVGAWDEPGAEIGPLINDAAVVKVESHIDDAVSKGARVLAGGQRHDRGGTFFAPTVLCDVTSDMRIAREETFGPVAPLFRFDDEADIIAAANATDYGLAGYFFTRELGRAWRVAEALQFGLVGVNEGMMSCEVAPFGGVKESGLGREGSHHGIEEFVEVKYVLMGGI